MNILFLICQEKYDKICCFLCLFGAYPRIDSINPLKRGMDKLSSISILSSYISANVAAAHAKMLA